MLFLTSCAYIDFGIILVLSILRRVRRGRPKALGIIVGKRVHLSPLYILLQGYRMFLDGSVVGGMRPGKVSRSNLLYDVRLQCFLRPRPSAPPPLAIPVCAFFIPPGRIRCCPREVIQLRNQARQDCSVIPLGHRCRARSKQLRDSGIVFRGRVIS